MPSFRVKVAKRLRLHRDLKETYVIIMASSAYNISHCILLVLNETRPNRSSASYSLWSLRIQTRVSLVICGLPNPSDMKLPSLISWCPAVRFRAVI